MLIILVIGSGGREHALCWALARGPRDVVLHAAPGNPGIAALATCHDVGVDDLDGLCALAARLKPDLVVVGPEGPLVAGLADRLRAQNCLVFGPSQAAAQLEGSKIFMKDFCARHHLPTAAYKSFTDAAAACAYIDAQGAPIVIKASGLAAGKGVVVAMDNAEAKQAVHDMLVDKRFGAAGQSIVIEEFLDGEEISYFALCSGTDYVALGSAQDHKRVGDGDTGPNTGGMGAYAPARLMTPALEAQILETIIEPTLRGMAAEGMPFTGVLFAGIMVVGGRARLLEFNVRFGDPECQALMMRMDGDLAAVLVGAAQGQMGDAQAALRLTPNPSLCVVMAAQGYPAVPKQGGVISGFEAAAEAGAVVFHAGTALRNGQVIASGGRVLGVAACADTLQDARTIAYAGVKSIKWGDGFYRTDIGWRALKSQD